MAKRSNESWIKSLQRPGDAQVEALNELREYLLRAVYVYLRDRRPELSHYTNDDLLELAEDFAQEALLSIQDNLDSFRGQARFTTWAYRFVINEAASELRRRRYQNVSLDELQAQTAVFNVALETDKQLDPEFAAERQELFAYLTNIIQNELSERQQLAIVGVHFQHLSIQEVAELLDTSPNTLYKILHDARKKIKAKLLARHFGAGDILALFDRLR